MLKPLTKEIKNFEIVYGSYNYFECHLHRRAQAGHPHPHWRQCQWAQVIQDVASEEGFGGGAGHHHLQEAEPDQGHHRLHHRPHRAGRADQQVSDGWVLNDSVGIN